MPNREAKFKIVLLAIPFFAPVLNAQSVTPSSPAMKQQSSNVSRVPDLTGPWAVPGGSPSLDPDDPRGARPEQLPMTPWAIERMKGVRPPFGAHATFEAVNDPVQKYCDPPGVTRLYLYPWNFSLVQGPGVVYILYEFMGFWRPVALGREHPKDPDLTWMGDSIGKYEGDTFVVDTIGFNDKTWIDQVGHPHSDQLHLIERFRRVNPDSLEVSLTFDDPKAYPKPFTVKRTFKRSMAPMEETVCSLTEMQSFDDEVMKTTTTQTPRK
ncbi:MAG: hypothetical protein LAO08_09930 [Acidobacteriia bacterium]|nr:hypothetical protein [Terriglobia bacterium]